MELSEKVAYLKGLAEGLELGHDTKEEKLLHAIIDCLDEMADSISILDEDLYNVEEEVDAISADLEDVENELFDEEDDDEEECYSTTCPNCEEEIIFDDVDLSLGNIYCPNCGEKIEFDFNDFYAEDQD